MTVLARKTWHTEESGTRRFLVGAELGQERLRAPGLQAEAGVACVTLSPFLMR